MYLPPVRAPPLNMTQLPAPPSSQPAQPSNNQPAAGSPTAPVAFWASIWTEVGGKKEKEKEGARERARRPRPCRHRFYLRQQLLSENIRWRHLFLCSSYLQLLRLHHHATHLHHLHRKQQQPQQQCPRPRLCAPRRHHPGTAIAVARLAGHLEGAHQLEGVMLKQEAMRERWGC